MFGVGAYAPREERVYESLRGLRGDVIVQVLDWIG
jgi:hypothetical protein